MRLNASSLRLMGDRCRVSALRKVVPILPCLLSLAGICGCTWMCFRLGTHLASVGFLYLVFVVLAAVYGGFWQATLLSVISVALSRLLLRRSHFQLQRGASFQLGGVRRIRVHRFGDHSALQPRAAACFGGRRGAPRYGTFVPDGTPYSPMGQPQRPGPTCRVGHSRRVRA